MKMIKENREKYLKSLAVKFEVDIEIVKEIADALGENEDLDGLPNCLEEYKALGWI